MSTNQSHAGTNQTTFVRDAKPKDRSAVERIYEDRWGAIHPGALDWVFDSNAQDAECLVAIRDGEVLGFGNLLFGSAEWASDCLGPARIDFALADDPVEPVAYFQMGCVDRRFENRGVGTMLFRARYQNALGHDAAWAAGVCWLRDDDIPTSQPLFEKFGFAEQKRVEQYYWKQETTRTACPDCNGVCKCHAMVYARRISK